MSLEDLLEDLEQAEKEIGQEETIDSSSGAGQGGAGTGGLFGSTTFTGRTAQSLADGFGQSGSGLFEGGSSMFGNNVDLPDRGDDPFGIPEFEDIEQQDSLLDRLNSMLGGIGQSELQGIWADPTVQEILTANSIRMTPDAPWDEQLGSLSPEALTQLIEAIQNIESGEIVVDPNQSTIPADTTASEGDTTTTQEEEESGGIWGTIRDWWNSVSTGGPRGGGRGTMPFPGPGAGVEIDIEDIFTPGNWRVFLPGVIPGLPQSNTIIGTIQDILEDPSEVLGDLWNRIEEAADDPLGTLEGILNEAADSEGLITIGGIAGVVNEVIGRYGSPDESADEADSGLPLGGDEEEDRGSIVVRGESDPDAPVLGGAGGGASSGGSAGGGQVASRPSFDEFTPFMKRIQYQPVAVPKAIVPDAPIVSSLFEEFLK